MKKIRFYLVLIGLLFVAGCGAKDSDKTSRDDRDDGMSVEATTEQSAIDQLNEKEKEFFDAFIKITSEDFYNPSEARVLELGDYREHSIYDDPNDDMYILYGPDTIVAKIQGENKVGGTLSHYYEICIVSGENKGEYVQKLIERYEASVNSSVVSNKEEIHHALFGLKGEAGDYFMLEEGYKIEIDASDEFDFGKINKAIEEYWDEKGL